MKSATARFQMGHLGASPAVLAVVPKEELFQLLERHLCGDWGDVSDSDARANEADRSVTTILLAKEY